jgi:hypothetical protein
MNVMGKQERESGTEVVYNEDNVLQPWVFLMKVKQDMWEVGM